MSKPRAGNRMRLAVAAAAFATVGGGAPVATTARASVGFRGAVDVVAVSPATGRVLVGIEGGKPGSGLWWSDDRGAHWHVALGLGKASGVTALAFSPSQPNVVYAGADWLTARGLASGFLVSSDGGTSWRAAKWRQSVDVFQASAAIEELVVDPSSPDTVYADTRGVLRRTLNAGKTWARIGAALPLAITGVRGAIGVAYPLDQQLVTDAAGALYYATTRARGPRQIYRSTNGGASWQPTATGLPAASSGSRMLELASDVSGPPGSVYAAAGERGVYVTRNAGSTWSTISLAAVRAASAPTNYPIPGSFTASPLTCTSVALDSRYPGTLYAVFSAVPRNSGPPPFYFVAYVTRNSGRTWQPVPVPAKSEMGRFGGFRVSPAGVQALFWSQATTDSSQPPAFLVEQTTDGGRTWPASSLRCPLSGPCIGLGPQDNGRCMAVGEWQAIEISTDGGQSWTSPGWPARLGACTTSELVGLDSNGMVAVDQMGAHTLTWSSDGGSSWEDVALPLLPGADADPGNTQGSLQILPVGRLLVAGSRWYLLGSGATAWCPVAAAPQISGGEWSASPRLIGDRLFWSDPTAGAAVGVTLRSFAISAVHC